MKDIAYCNTQFKRFAKYFNGFVEKKQKYYIGFATETSENVWWYDGSKVMIPGPTHKKIQLGKLYSTRSKTTGKSFTIWRKNFEGKVKVN